MSSPASGPRVSARGLVGKPHDTQEVDKDGDSAPTPTPRSSAATARRAALAERTAATLDARPSPLERSSALDRTSALDRSSSMAERTSGTGLSDYTSKRLEELRLRRAESAADSYSDYRSRRSDVTKPEKPEKPDLTSTAPSNTSSTTSDYMELKMRREREKEKENKENTKIAPTRPVAPPSSVTSQPTAVASRKEYSVPEKPSSGHQRTRGDNKDDEFVGFATLPDQVHRKAVKRGFDFTLMVVGETGLGKSTLVTSLFLNDLYKDRKVPPVEERVHKTVNILKNNLEIEEKGVKLRLTIVDTPGFNDSVNAEEGWRPIEEYIDQQFDQFFKDESGLNRKNIKDNRVHCCLYFIPPFGHGLRQIDVTFMKRLHEKVNVVPIIAKADTLTPTEIRKLKNKIMEQIEKHKIKVYEFPECDSDEDEEFKQMDKELKGSVPFAVIGSNTIVEVNGRKVRGRLYPWGIVEVENPAHCDFSKLRTMLISTHMQDLKELTRDIHYESYRARYIKEQMNKNQSNARNGSEGGVTGVIVNTVRQGGKLKRDSTNFDSIIETDKLLEQKNEEIRRMQEMLLQMQHQLQSNRNQHNGNL